MAIKYVKPVTGAITAPTVVIDLGENRQIYVTIQDDKIEVYEPGKDAAAYLCLVSEWDTCLKRITELVREYEVDSRLRAQSFSSRGQVSVFQELHKCP